MEIDRAENIDALQKTILECLALNRLIFQPPAPTEEVETLGPISTTLTVQVWLENRDFGGVLSDLKKRCAIPCRERRSVPRFRAVAPWTPPTETQAETKKPNKVLLRVPSTWRFKALNCPP